MDLVAAHLALLVDASTDIQDATAFRGLARAGVDVDLGMLARVPGLRLAGELAAMSGEPLDGYPAWQGLSNVDAEPFVAPGEVYLDETVGIVDARLGRLDAAGILGVPDAGAPFLNPTYGFSPVLYGLPTYPAPALGAAVQVAPGPGELTVAGWAGETAPAVATQLGARWADDAGHAAVGGWTHPDEDAAGGWAFVEQSAHLSKAMVGTVFAYAGAAGSTAAGLTPNVLGGVTLTGLIPHREADLLGVAASWASCPDLGAELIGEAVYTFQAADELAISADVQTTFSATPASAGTVRLAITI